MHKRDKSSSKWVVVSIAAIGLTILIYNYHIYTSQPASQLAPMSTTALQGEQIWQDNNCTACHQLYGLGGYLGPDLTNVISSQGKGPAYVRAFVKSGVRSMPAFPLADNEIDALTDFLTHIDQTGYYPNTEARVLKNGWVDLKYKSLTDEN